MKLQDLPLHGAKIHTVPLDKIVIVDGFNIRYDLGDIAAGIARIRATGVELPLIGREVKGKWEISAGHRRTICARGAVAQINDELRTARIDKDNERIKRLEDELFKVTNLPMIEEEEGKSEADRNFTILSENDGKPLTILEEALLFQRLMTKYKVSEAEIIRRTSRSKTHVHNCALLLNGACEELLDAVKTGKFSATLAIETVRNKPDKKEQAALVKEALEKAAAQGKQAASAKHLNEADKQKIAPSKASKKAGASSGGGGGGDLLGNLDTGSKSQAPAPSVPAPAPKPPEKVKLGKKKIEVAKLPPKCGVEARVIVAEVLAVKGNAKYGWVIGVEIKYAGAKKFTGTEPDVEEVRYSSAKLASYEGLAILNDHLLAAKRSTEKANDKVDWAVATAAVTKLAEKAKAKLPNQGPPSLKSTSAETLVPKDAAAPVQHIIALRDKMKTKKNGTTSERYKALNFIADYLTGRYEPEAFEKFITEFLDKKDNK